MKLSLLFIFSGFLSHQLFPQQHTDFKFDPKQYVCYRVSENLDIDGVLQEESWDQAPWTAAFVDIQGSLKPAPLYETKAKMLWDDEYFYVAVEMVEPDIWATYDQRDAVIYQEHDFEVFIDPDGDTHNYYELEINALGTIWDLMVLKPYRDGGPAINGWDVAGLKSGVKIYGSLNDPSDKDDRWTVELAFPWKILKEAAPNGRKPIDGDQWRVNFSRVNWKIEEKNKQYRKIINPATGKSYSEFNWVWSPQGAIAMHQPETWGSVQFSNKTVGRDLVEFRKDPKSSIKWTLRKLYYAQAEYLEDNGIYSEAIEDLNLPNDIKAQLHEKAELLSNKIGYTASWQLKDSWIVIDHEGRIFQK